MFNYRKLYEFRVTVILMILWSALLGLSYSWNLSEARQQIMQQAYAEARANLNKDITFRRWGTSHGGVYVPITDKQKSVPWLRHVPGRDVTTTDGKELTLLNPASMLRQMMQAYADEYGIKGRITGLKYLNPGNKPDEWEEKQLTAFTKGERKEIWDIAEIDNEPHLRYLRAMFMEPGCEKCHAILGYKQGDMRGATGLNLPLAPYYSLIAATKDNLILTHLVIWLLGFIGIATAGQIAQQRKDERLRREQEKEREAKVLQMYANAFESSGEAILITDSHNKIIKTNAAFTKLTGYELDEIRDQNPRILGSGDTPETTYQEMWAALKEEGFWQGELWERNKDGVVYPKWTAISAINDDLGELAFYIASYTDISERKAAEARISHLAHHDILTGLYNRYSLEERLEQAILSAKRGTANIAVFFIDLDHFKNINDSLGHQTGDLLLVEAANRLRKSVRQEDILARIGGDEFILVLTKVNNSVEAAKVADKVLTSLAFPYLINDRQLELSASIGISFAPMDGNSVEALLKNADVAMYQAKNKGRNNYQFFTQAMSVTANERLQVEHEIRYALYNRQFTLNFQPQFKSEDLSICGAEALIRWHHPEKGFIPPDKFIPVAEDMGVIHQIGEWVIDEACRQLTEIKKLYPYGFRMSVNLSAKQLQADNLVKIVESAVNKHQVSSGELELEITETAAMVNPEYAVQQLTALNKLGVTLAIDDFGTGYSSLAYLKRLPIHTLKLDRTFVKDIGTDQNDEEISIATITLAHNLGLYVVAEGVETQEQADFLKEHNCDYLQGYLLSKPLPYDELISFIQPAGEADKA